ncbi:MAG TPA: hypothetical protein VK608_00870 [Edaphobacter sp.]|nr:hypothetical protein [Edaphobacter sp.]
MKFYAWVMLGVVAAMSSSSVMAGQPATPTDPPAVLQAEVSFQFERIGLPVPRFTVQVREDGTGRYQADEAAGSSSQSSSAVRYVGEKHIDRSITLSSATVAKIFKAARGLDRFNVACASKAKNIADTGKKTLSYVGADGRGSCTYNYSEIKSVTTLTDTFLAIAFTMDEGRKLDFLHRYDRLGLDAEMTTLMHEMDEGRALELGTIAPSLYAIAGDTALIQRVRLRAAKLLEQTKDDK